MAEAEIQAQVMGLISSVAEKIDYVTPLGTYRCRVELSESDHVIMRRVPVSAITATLGDVIALVNGAIAAGDELTAMSVLDRALDAGSDTGIWATLDTLLTPAIVRIEAPEYEEAYGQVLLCPSGPIAERVAWYTALPDCILKRLVGGLVWMLAQ